MFINFVALFTDDGINPPEKGQYIPMDNAPHKAYAMLPVYFSRFGRQ